MKKFRNPNVSLILAFLILIVSCSEPTMDNIEIINSKTLSETIKDHIFLSAKISKIFSEEKNIDFEKLNKFPTHFNNKEIQIKNLKDANLKNAEEISNLYEELGENLENFLHSIKNTENYTKKDLEILLNNEIRNQFTLKKEKNSKYLSKVDPCLEALNEAGSNCEENYAISLAAVVLSGFITFGWGTVIGYGVATGIMVKCYEDSSTAYRNCVENQ